MLKAVILAAGQGTRMKSKLPKVVHKVMGKCMVEHAITAAREAGADEICVVVGHGADIVKREITSNVTFVTQDKQLGTGHAVKCARDFIGKDGSTLILFGDTPLITGETLNRLVKAHEFEGNAIILQDMAELSEVLTAPLLRALNIRMRRMRNVFAMKLIQVCMFLSRQSFMRHLIF
jgi:bifunctional N-acetylglucosamine-1-phosphate-uridyltransferase/glucosamine-1-phosphate-acetyltransferase GlmU-like protein